MDIHVGDILQITGNSTGHCYDNGTRVMVCVVSTNGSCEVSDGKTNQYLDKDCFAVQYADNWIAPDFEKATIIQRLSDTQLLVRMPLTMSSPKVPKRIRTQKARGLRAIWPLNNRLEKGWTTPIVISQPLTPEFPSVSMLPLMARPCPIRPRHGFVESRQVHSVEEVNQVLSETLVADPKGEVILMPFLD